MKAKSVLEIEMFGCDPIEPTRKTIPDLPMDGDPFWLETTGGRSAEQVQDQEFIKAVSGCDWKPILTPKPAPAAPLAEFTKRAPSKGLTRQDIASHMTKYYSHGIWKQWETMMTALIGSTEFDERVALSFLMR